jgi:hypothetical protein
MKIEIEVRGAKKCAEGLEWQKSPTEVGKFFTSLFEGRDSAMQALGIENDFMVYKFNKNVIRT